MTIRARLLGSVSAVGVSVAGVVMPTPAAVAAPPTPFTWTGFYIGGSAGGAFLLSDFDQSAGGFAFVDLGGTFPGTPSVLGSKTGTSILGGGQLGYNWQQGNVVFGIEADYSGLNARSRANGSVSAGSTFLGTTSASTVAESHMTALATLRARIGMDYGGTLPYFTIGVAAADIAHSFTFSDPGGFGPPPRTAIVADSGWRTGIAVGGGFERQLDQRWSFRAEALWVGFADRTLATAAFNTAYTFAANGRVTFSDDLVIGRIGLNFRF